MKRFVRGRFYFINSEPNKIKKRKTINLISRLKRRISKRITRSFSVTKRRVKRRNLTCKSYFRRYILPRKKRLFRRTRKTYIDLFDYYLKEKHIFNNLRENIKRLELNIMLKQKWGQRSKFRPLSKRKFSLGKVYLTHRRRNTFITIFHIAPKGEIIKQRVIYKVSAGLIGYAGPKRSTKHAREAVAKQAGTYLAYNKFTSIDIILTASIGRIFRHLIKALFRTPIYVRHLIVTKRRSHGFTRLRKARRT